MKITKEQLIEQLIEHSQLPREVVEKEFDQFIAETSGVIKGNPLTIEEMGVFRLKKGRLSFETDPKLALEINYKYAGMLPIEVKKGQTSSQDDEIHDEENATSLLSKNDDNEKVQIGKVRESKKEEPVKAVEKEIIKETSMEEVKEEQALTEESSDGKAPIEEIEELKVDATPLISEEVKNQEPEKTVQETKESTNAEPKVENVAEVKKDTSTKTSTKTSSKKEDDKTMTYATIAAAVIIIAAIIWFMNTKPKEVIQPDSEITQVKPTVKREVKTEEKLAPEQTSMEKAQSEKPLKETKEQSQGKSDGVYKEGLKDIDIKSSSTAKLDSQKEEIVQDIVNQLQESANPVVATKPKVYYTAVIYTLSFKARAHQEVESFKKKGFSAFVKAFKNRNNEERFYVCIGKLESYKDAKEFAETKLPEPFNSSKNFAVKRLTD
ncbi:MAG: hypothetical protein GW809_06705 [Bacteroidetes bacterium]|nr:hypothetical protein [Bacteroidota bacterium]